MRRRHAGRRASTAAIVRVTVDAVGGSAGTRSRCPTDYPTIQAAVDAAAPGDLVLVSPGIYNEAVNVTTEPHDPRASTATR